MFGMAVWDSDVCDVFILVVHQGLAHGDYW